MAQQIHSGKGDNVAGNKTTNIRVTTKLISLVIFVLGVSSLTVYLWPDAPQLHGVVTSSADIPLADAKVTLNIPGKEALIDFTDSAGEFVFEKVNPKKLDKFSVEAQLEERTITQQGNGLEALVNPVIVKLPPGIAPFEEYYIDFEGFELDFIFDGKVKSKMESNLGGQPFIVPNKVFRAFKDLAEKFHEPACENFAFWMENMEICMDEKGEIDKSIKTVLGKRNYKNEIYDRLFSSANFIFPESAQWDQYDSLREQFIFNEFTEEEIWSFKGKPMNLNGWKEKFEALRQFDEKKDHSNQALSNYTDLFESYIKNAQRPFKESDYKFLLGDNQDRLASNSDIIMFYQYVTQENRPDDFFRIGIGLTECAQEFNYLLNAPDLKLKVAILENNTGAPLPIDSFYITENSKSGLRLLAEDRESRTEEKAVKLLPNQTLTAGGKLMIPLSMQFVYRPAMRVDESKDNVYVFGPSININAVKVGIERYPFRQFDPEVYVSYGGIMRGASCPFVYTYDEFSDQWLLENHILENRVLFVNKGVDTLRLKRFTGDLIIRELDPEESYIDLIKILKTTEEGEVTEMKHDNRLLNVLDEEYLHLNQGDEIKVHFTGFDPVEKARYHLISYGWYEPYQLERSHNNQ